MIKTGDKLPEVSFSQLTKEGVMNPTTSQIFANKKVVLFAVPGAFTPTCSASHLPGYIALADQIKAKGVDVGKPIRKPKGGEIVPHGMALSDDFSTNKFGIQWSFFRGDVTENQRVNYKHGALELTAKGTSPSNTSPLTFLAGDQAYQFVL